MRFRLIPLEERIVLDASLTAVVVEAVTDTVDAQVDDALLHEADAILVDSATEELSAQDDAPELLVVSEEVEGYKDLVLAADPDTLVLTYDANTSLAQLEQQIKLATAGRTLDSIGFVNHGNQGRFYLTADVAVSMESLESSSELRSFWEGMGALVRDGGRIDLLACNLAESDPTLLEALDDLTENVSIAASSNVTGFGGDWILEYGGVDAGALYFEGGSIENWAHTLAITVVDDDIATDEDNTVDVTEATLVGNDLSDDPPVTFVSFDDALTTGLVTSASGTITYDPDGQFEYLAVGETAFDTFDYDAVDGMSNLGTGTVTVEITGVNDDPTAVDDIGLAALDTDEDTALLIDPADLTANDTDPDLSDVLFISDVDDSGSVGTINILATSGPEITSFEYDPNGQFETLAVGQSATDTFEYTTDDGNGGQDVGLVTVDIEGVNDAPTAVDDSGLPGLTTDEDTVLTILNTVINANDFDIDDGDTFTITAVDSVSAGGALISSTGGGAGITDITYDPRGFFDFLGLLPGAIPTSTTDTFTYQITDSHGATATATVSVLVTAVNDLPTGVTDSISVVEDGPLVTIPVATFLSNDTDIDQPGDILSIIGLNLNQDFNEFGELQDPPLGTVDVIESGGSITHITYLPGEYFPDFGDGTIDVGADRFFYTLSDGFGDSIDVEVTVDVTGINDVPVVGTTILADAPADVTTDYDEASVRLGVFDADVDDVISITAIGPETLTGGVLTPTFVSGFLTTLEFDPNGDFDQLGTDATTGIAEQELQQFEFTFEESNTGLFYTGFAEFNVVGVNDDPIGVDDPDLATGSREVLVIDTVADLLDDDSDVDQNDTLGILSLDTTATLGTVGITQTGASGEALEIEYDPGAAFAGLAIGATATDTFIYNLTDFHTGVEVPTLVTITVTGQPPAPVVVNDAVNASEDTTILIDAADLLVNDTLFGDIFIDDVQGPTLQGFLVLFTGGGGEIEQIGYDPNGQFEFLAEGQSVLEVFDYTIENSLGEQATGQVSITVLGVNDAPDADGDTFTTQENTPFVINSIVDLLNNDTDIDNGDILRVVAADATGSNGGELIQTIDPITSAITSMLFNPGTDFDDLLPGETRDTVFNYTIRDNFLGFDSSTITITVEGVNDAPIPQDDLDSVIENSFVDVNVLANDSDADHANALLTLALGAPPSNGSFALIGPDTIRYTPTPGYFGSDSFTYSLTDPLGASQTATVFITVIPDNFPPTANDDNVSTPEDIDLVIDPLANDTDPELATLTVTQIISGPSNGIANITGGGATITYEPADDYNGPDQIVYEMTDGAGNFEQATIFIDVTPVNDDPVVDSFTLNTNEDVATAPDDLDNRVSDVDLDPLTFSISVDPTNGEAVINPVTNEVTYTPDDDFNGVDTFEYEADDGQGGVVSGVVTVNVAAVPDNPVALDDNATLNEDSMITVLVLTNDSDADLETLTITQILSGPDFGGAIINGGTSITYTPSQHYFGPDSLVYEITDGTGRFATATLNLTVLPVQDPPEGEDFILNTNEDTPVMDDLDTRISDPDPDTLGVILLTQPSDGEAVLDNVTNIVTYTPDEHFNGVDSFQYQVSDGQGGIAVHTITVNVAAVQDVPEPQDDSASLNEDTDVTVAVLANDTDPDMDTLTVTQIISGPSNGVAMINVGDNTITYTPTGDYFGPDSLVYEVSDGQGGLATATVNFTVNPVQDDPTADNVSVTTNEDVTVIEDLDNAVDDVDGDTLTVTIIGVPANGTAEILVGTNQLSYTPNQDFNGSDTVQYQVSDGNGNTATGEVAITVNPVNDDPTADNLAVTTDEDVAVLIDLSDAIADVEDPDVDLMIQVIGGPSNGGTAIGTSSITYTPFMDYNGPDQITYLVTDTSGATASGVIDITVNPVGDPIVANPDSATGNRNIPLNIDILNNDDDPDNEVLTIEIISDPTDGGVVIEANNTVTYTPNLNFLGPDQFTYRITDSDGNTSEAVVDVTINFFNTDPVALDTSAVTDEEVPVAIDVASLISDLDQDSLIVSIDSGPSFGGAGVLGTVITYSPGLHYNGPDSITYKVTDAFGGMDTGVISITVNPVNDAPTAAAGADVTLEEVPVLITPTVFDQEGQTLTLTIVDGPSNGMVAVDDPNDQFTYTPALDFFGTDFITYRVTDPFGAFAEAVRTITVINVNDAPVAVPDSYGVRVDAPRVLTPLENDIDVDGDTLTSSVVAGPFFGLVTPGPGNTFLYDPNGHVGPDSFDVRIEDPSGAFSVATVNINVEPVPTLWAIDEADGQLVSFDDPDNPLATAREYGELVYAGSLDPVGDGIEALAIDGDANAYIAINSPGSTVLGVFDLNQTFEDAPGVVTPLGPIGSVLASESVTGLAFDPVSGYLYGLVQTAPSTPDRLIVIDPVDGSLLSKVGRIVGSGAVVGAEDIAFDDDGKLYVTDASSDKLYRISPSNGAIIEVVDAAQAGGIGLSVDLEALTYDQDDGQLLAVERVDTQLVELTLADGGNLPVDPLTSLGLTDVEALEFFPLNVLVDGSLIQVGTDGVESYIATRPAKLVVDEAAVFSTPGLNYDTGTLRLAFLDGTGTIDDVLDIKPNGPVNINPGTLFYNGTPIGTYTGGAGGSPLVVQFAGTGVDAAMVRDVVEAVSIENVNESTTFGIRRVGLDLTASSGEESNRAVQQVDVLDPALFNFGFTNDVRVLPAETRHPFNELLPNVDLAEGPRLVTVSSALGDFFYDPDGFEASIVRGIFTGIADRGPFIQFYATQSTVEEILNNLFFETPDWGNTTLEVTLDDLGSSGGAPRIDTFNIDIQVEREGGAPIEGDEDIPEELPPVDRG